MVKAELATLTVTFLSTEGDSGDGPPVTLSTERANRPKLGDGSPNSPSSTPVWEGSCVLDKLVSLVGPNLPSIDEGASINFCSRLRDPEADTAMGYAERSRAAGWDASERTESEVKF